MYLCHVFAPFNYSSPCNSCSIGFLRVLFFFLLFRLNSLSLPPSIPFCVVVRTFTFSLSKSSVGYAYCLQMQICQLSSANDIYVSLSQYDSSCFERTHTHTQAGVRAGFFSYSYMQMCTYIMYWHGLWWVVDRQRWRSTEIVQPKYRLSADRQTDR